MAYADQPKMSNSRIAAIVSVAIIHALLGYAFVTGLAFNVVKKVAADLKTFNVEEPPPPDQKPPPPPPPQPNTPPPVVSPPPIVRTNTLPPPTNAPDISPTSLAAFAKATTKAGSSRLHLTMRTPTAHGTLYTSASGRFTTSGKPRGAMTLVLRGNKR